MAGAKDSLGEMVRDGARLLGANTFNLYPEHGREQMTDWKTRVAWADMIFFLECSFYIRMRAVEGGAMHPFNKYFMASFMGLAWVWQAGCLPARACSLIRRWEEDLGMKRRTLIWEIFRKQNEQESATAQLGEVWRRERKGSWMTPRFLTWAVGYPRMTSSVFLKRGANYISYRKMCGTLSYI